MPLPGSVTVDFCQSCRGAFFEPHEVLVHLPTPEATPSPYLPCPCGEGTLHPGSYFQGKLELERCDDCGGIWFDAGEVLALREYSGSKEVVGLQPGFSSSQDSSPEVDAGATWVGSLGGMTGEFARWSFPGLALLVDAAAAVSKADSRRASNAPRARAAPAPRGEAKASTDPTGSGPAPKPTGNPRPAKKARSAKRHSRLQGIAYLLVGLTLLSAGPVLGLLAGVGLNSLQLGLLIFGILLLVGVGCCRSAFKTLARTGAEALTDDPRPPIVYLRSFADDETAVKAPQLKDHLVLSTLLEVGEGTEEEQIATLLGSLGPFVAIGDPSDELPDLGAARLYVDHADWQAKVEELLRRCALVVLRAASTPGFMWEVQRSFELLRPNQVLILIPVDWKHRRYEEFAKALPPSIRPPLPPLPPMSEGCRSLRGILYFDAAGRPRMASLSSRGILWKGSTELGRSLSRALEPIFAQSHPDWVPVLKLWRHRRRNRLAWVGSVWLAHALITWIAGSTESPPWLLPLLGILICPVALGSLYAMRRL
ncbi:MAG: zf-TFIIB domain-containing protein [Elusimicrobia bacterium]|nr:zf-TFIIB domain-containing protein [Elusimicrobiota bacterium]